MGAKPKFTGKISKITIEVKETKVAEEAATEKAQKEAAHGDVGLNRRLHLVLNSQLGTQHCRVMTKSSNISEKRKD